MLNIDYDEKRNIVKIGGSFKVKDFKESKDFIKASLESEE